MQLVGAPQTFIRGPFVMEGVLQGGIGAVAGPGAAGAAFLAVRGQYLVAACPDAEPVVGSGFLRLSSALLLLVGGMLVGCLGGLVAASSRT